MTEEMFEASSGIKISRAGRGVYDHRSRRNISMSDSEVAALREFFQHERDKELRQWRSPEEPDYIVRPAVENPDWVSVYFEPLLVSRSIRRGDRVGLDYAEMGEEGLGMYRAADAYFAAHPEPKPWHDAKPGEVWAIVVDGDGEEHPAFTYESTTFDHGIAFRIPSRSGGFGARGTAITAARRIWPAEEVAA